MGDIPEGNWVNTSCNGCFNVCAIQVKTVGNRVVGSRGNPEVPSSLGKVCGKSLARVADLYDPNRVTKPLIRTNPEKGIGVDPQWKEIDWGSALSIIVDRLNETRVKDPRGLVIATFDIHNMQVTEAFGRAFGTPNFDFYNAGYCGGGLHSVLLHTLGTVNAEIDVDRCERIVLWGAQFGLGANNNPTMAIRGMADARRRGAKVIVIDPLLGNAAAKADQWIPIIPGTDGALALAIVNLLLSEFKIFDCDFLKRKTNGTYLIDEKGQYVRDRDSGKPLVWNTASNSAQPYDCIPHEQAALEGHFTIQHLKVETAFECLRRTLREWTEDKAAEITGVPAETIRQFALDHGQAAKIGATITIEGKVLPLRPAAIEFKRGVTAHKNGYLSCAAVQLINIILGAVEVPGALLGLNTYGPFGLWEAKAGLDGLVETNLTDLTGFCAFNPSYPPRQVKVPDSLNMDGLFPVSSFLASMPHYGMSEPEKIGLTYRPTAMIACRTNFIKSYHDPQAIADYLKRLDFILAFARQVDETAEFADIVLPEAHDYERYFLFPVNHPAGYQAPGPGEWYMQFIQPVVSPPDGVRNWIDVLMDIAEELEILPAVNERLNQVTGVVPPYTLNAAEKYTLEDICKKQIRSYASTLSLDNPERQLQETGKIALYPKSLKESYPGSFLDARIPIYFEHFIGLREEVEKLCREQNLTWLDTSFYAPVPNWHPCPAHAEHADQYDLFLANGKAAILAHSYNSENPWVDDICEQKRYYRYILLHTFAAKERGLSDEDEVYVESATGRVRGRLRVTECVHPKVVGTFGNGGGWAKRRPIAAGKGVHSNSLIQHDWSMLDPISGQIDTCARVRIYKAED